jgi:hypothetical protein
MCSVADDTHSSNDLNVEETDQVAKTVGTERHDLLFLVLYSVSCSR